MNVKNSYLMEYPASRGLVPPLRKMKVVHGDPDLERLQKNLKIMKIINIDMLTMQNITKDLLDSFFINQWITGGPVPHIQLT